MRPDFNARRTERLNRFTECAKAAEELAAQARATIAEWDAQIREELHAPRPGATDRPPDPSGPPQFYEQLERELEELEKEAEATRGSLEQEERAARDWEMRAMLAVEELRDDLARIALKRHEQHREACEALHGELWILRAVIEDCRVVLRARGSNNPA